MERVGDVGGSQKVKDDEEIKKLNELVDKVKKENTEYYFFGTFDGIFIPSVVNKDIAQETSGVLFDKVITKDEDLCVIGYGQSGSGKTSSLIYLKITNSNGTTTEVDGILVELCNLKEFTNKFDLITLQMTNIYVNHGLKRNSPVDIKSNDYRVEDIEIDGEKQPEFEFDGKKWSNITTEKKKEEIFMKNSPKPVLEVIKKQNTKQKLSKKEQEELKEQLQNQESKKKGEYEKKMTEWNKSRTEFITRKKSIGEFINDAFEKRQVEPTPNNPNSSRSHVLVCLTLRKKGEKESRKIVVCDLAGVENVFQCGLLSEILKFDERYGESDKYNEKKGKNEIEYDVNYCEQPDIPDKIIDDDLYKIYNEHYNDMLKDVREYNKLSIPTEPIYDEKIEEEKKNRNNCINRMKVNELKDCKRKLIYKDDTKFMEVVNHFEKTEGNGKEKYKQELMKKKEELKKILIRDRNIYSVIQNVQNLYYTYIETNYKGTAKQNLPKPKYTLKLLFDKNFMYYSEKPLEPSPFIKEGKQKFLLSSVLKVQKKGYEKEKELTNLDYFLQNNLTHDNLMYQVVYAFLLNDEGVDFGKAGTGSSQFRSEVIFLNKDRLEDYKKIFHADLQNYKDILCEIHRFNKLTYNCGLRVNEGYMINRSLYDLRTDIKELIMNSIKIPGENPSEKILPLIYDKDVFTYCRNAYIEDEYYFNKETATKSLSGQITQILSETYHVDLTKLNFAVFTVINLNNDGKTDNPPNPPYVNLSNLIYNLSFTNGGMQIDTNNQILLNELNKLKNKTKTFNFYRNNNNMKQIWDEIALLGDDPSELEKDQVTNVVLKFIKCVESNNPSSLIGSVESTDLIQNITFNKVVCSYNPNIEEKFDYYKQMILQKSDIEGSEHWDIEQIFQNYKTKNK